VTRASIHEYAEALKKRYRRAGKEERGRILDEFCRTTSYHRKSAVRLLGRGIVDRARPRGRPATYGGDVTGVLRQIWEASDRLCSKRLVGFLPDLVAALERHGELRLDEPVRSQLSHLSAATIDRLLREVRPRGLRRPQLGGAEPTSLKAQIPVRTFGEWEGVNPGAVQADLVVHCGTSAEGFFLTTLDAVDVATGWTECVIVWGRGQDRVGAAMHAVQSGLPFPMRDLHTDNGSEFLTSEVYPRCQGHATRLTHARRNRRPRA